MGDAPNSEHEGLLSSVPSARREAQSSMWLPARFQSVLDDVIKYRRAYTMAAVASFGGMLFGWDTGLIGGVLTMKAFQKSFGLDPDHDKKAFANLQGNIVSVLQAGCFLGAGLSFFVSDIWGRKRALLIAVAVFLAGSLMQTCSGINTTGLGLLYAGRFIGGVGVGLVSAVVPTYIGENANREIRGRCIGMMQLFNVTGIMLSFFVNYGINRQITDGSSKTWRIPTALQMLPGMLLLIGMLFQNESPRWLVEKQQVEKARAALAHVRGKALHDESVDQELAEIVSDFKGKERLSLRQQVQSVTATREVWYPVVMAMWLQWFQQWSGTNSINYFAPQIFQSIGLGGTNAGLFATGIYGVVKVVMTGLCLMLAVEQLGRKWSLIIGGLGQAFAMLYIGIYSGTHPLTNSSSSSSSTGLSAGAYFSIVCVYLFVVFYSLAWGFVPYILTSECSPNHVRSLVLAAALMLQWACNCMIAKLTPIMLATIAWGTYLVFGAACVLMALYAAVFVPETKGVPLESVHLLFRGGVVRGALMDLFPRHQRARQLQRHSHVDDNVATHKRHDDNDAGGHTRDSDSSGGTWKHGRSASHIELTP